MRSKSLSLILVASTVVLAILILHSSAHASAAGDYERASAIIRIVEKAEARVKTLASNVQSNTTMITIIRNTGLEDEFSSALTLINEGSEFLASAKEHLSAGNYSKSIADAFKAMKLFKEAFKAIHQVLEQADLIDVEGLALQAQGLLVAAQKALERVEYIRSLPNASEVNDLLNQAENLLKSIEQLLARGDISEAARTLAEAKQLIAQAFSTLNSKAMEKLEERAQKYLDKIEKLYARISNASNETREVIQEAFNQARERLMEIIRAATKGKVLEYLKDFIDEVKQLREEYKAVKQVVKRYQPTKTNISDILKNLEQYKGKTVIVSGKYCGQQQPKNLPGPAAQPPPGNWWIIADETGWMYVLDRQLLRTPRVKVLENLMEEVMVVGVVRVEVDTTYIDAKLTLLKAPKEPPKEPPKETSTTINISVEVQHQNKRTTIIKVKVTNAGGDVVVFPNGAYGITIERSVNGEWIFYYSPPSIQVLVELDPGESKRLTLQLFKPPSGKYRVVATGWIKDSRLPVQATAEFTIP
ncbi:MAG: hypothetical protein RMI99_03170 [Nitrososphaerota archaeon]|nr:hypothetical protein [Candidatus Nezhaarchaeota archaeon]MDW8050061.1 hypothetical protein [Nitrososphaerota archaeon]